MDRQPYLNIDLNEEPSPPPSPPQQSAPREFSPPIFAPPPLLPPPPPPLPLQLPPPHSAQFQLQLAHEAREISLAYHRGESLRIAAARVIAAATAGSSVGPAQHPGEAGWGNPPPPCASCGHPEVPKATIICDACGRGFHESCIFVFGAPMRQPPPPPLPALPGVRRPPVPVNEDWRCPQCELRGACSNRWKLGAVPLDINAAPREDPDAVAVQDITRQLSQLPLNHLLMIADLLISQFYSSNK